MHRLLSSYPTQEGWYYLFLLAFVFTGAILREINLMLLVGGLMVGPLAYNFFASWRQLRGITFRRLLPQGCFARQRQYIQLELTGKSPNLQGLQITEKLYHADNPGESFVIEATVPWNQSGIPAQASYSVLPLKRGIYRFHASRLKSARPFGLWQSQAKLLVDCEWLVWPRLAQVDWQKISILCGQAIHDHAEQGRSRLAMSGDFAGLRPWRLGDHRRLIHWRSTAKRGELLVKQFDEPAQETVAIGVDLWCEPSAEPESGLRIEQLLAMAGSLIWQQQRRGAQRLHLLIAGKSFQAWTGAAQRTTCERFLTELALAEAATSPGLAPGRISRPGSGTLLVLTGRDVRARRTAAGKATETAGERLLRFWESHWPQGRVVLVEVGDPRLTAAFQWIEEPTK
ncbi:MAG: DUF58 domain-containing protein [Pirellulales bacterium]|nr:DUF58 domain-containing protein [Pirellulales bacterium]